MSEVENLWKLASLQFVVLAEPGYLGKEAYDAWVVLVKDRPTSFRTRPRSDGRETQEAVGVVNGIQLTVRSQAGRIDFYLNAEQEHGAPPVNLPFGAAFNLLYRLAVAENKSFWVEENSARIGVVATGVIAANTFEESEKILREQLNIDGGVLPDRAERIGLTFSVPMQLPENGIRIMRTCSFSSAVSPVYEITAEGGTEQRRLIDEHYAASAKFDVMNEYTGVALDNSDFGLVFDRIVEQTKQLLGSGIEHLRGR